MRASTPRTIGVYDGEPAARPAVGRRPAAGAGRGEALIEAHGRQAVTDAAARGAGAARERGTSARTACWRSSAGAADLLARPPSLRPVINATGVIVHTNLGRAPLAEVAIDGSARSRRATRRSSTTSTSGRRGSRHTSTLGALLRELTGAEDGLAVNNNAAAVLLCLAATARRRRGADQPRRADRDRRRLPDPRHPGPVGRAAGRGGHHQPHAARRLRAGDHAARRARSCACTSRTSGSSASPSATRSWRELARGGGARRAADRRPRLGGAARPARPAGRAHGAGQRRGRRRPRLLLRATSCWAGRRRASSSAAAEAVERVRRHPLAAGAAHRQAVAGRRWRRRCALYRDPAQAVRADAGAAAVAPSRSSAVRERAERLWPSGWAASVVDSVARIGGGAVPLLELPSVACALDGGDELAAGCARPTRR